MDKFLNNNNTIVAIAEMARGNGEIGEMWLETAVFNRQDTINEVLEWAWGIECSGRLIITVPTGKADE